MKNYLICILLIFIGNNSYSQKLSEVDTFNLSIDYQEHKNNYKKKTYIKSLVLKDGSIISIGDPVKFGKSSNKISDTYQTIIVGRYNMLMGMNPVLATEEFGIYSYFIESMYVSYGQGRSGAVIYLRKEEKVGLVQYLTVSDYTFKIGELIISTVSKDNKILLDTNEVDEFTGNIKKKTKKYNIAKGVSVIESRAIRIDDSYALSFSSNMNLGCSGTSDNYVIILFQDGTKLKLSEDISDIDCGENSNSIFIINPQDFLNKKIKKIRFSKSESYDDCETDGYTNINDLIKAVL